VPSETSAQVLTTLTGSSKTPLAAFHALGRHFTLQLGVFKDHKLMTSGSFALVRHPSYIGLLGVH
jgi:protein-S-isoprenylcysteine O-methyltransferase Ste14